MSTKTKKNNVTVITFDYLQNTNLYLKCLKLAEIF